MVTRDAFARVGAIDPGGEILDQNFQETTARHHRTHARITHRDYWRVSSPAWSGPIGILEQFDKFLHSLRSRQQCVPPMLALTVTEDFINNQMHVARENIT